LDGHRKIKLKAIRLLSKREYSLCNIEKKLSLFASSCNPQVNFQTVKSVIEELKSNDWISDERAVECLINRKVSSCGIIKLRFELKKLGVCNDLIENHLLRVLSSEHERALKLLMKKHKKLPSNLKEIVSQKNFLMRKGFLAEVCNKVVNDRLSQKLQ
tara:strand:+ start:919 stop:1392 length:474 start_codon:yes stop_codon:yes gene_type:complete